MYHSVVKVLKTCELEFLIKLQSLILCFNLQYCVLSKYKLCPCSVSLLLASNNICLYFQKSSNMLSKNTLGVKNARSIRSSTANT